MISIAMCTYNGSKHIREQLASIIGQSRQPDEIIICDDGSSDDTVKLARETLANWPGRSEVVENEVNLGFSRNFQKAIGLCQGEIIFLCDQDDIWNRDKIAIMTNALQEHPQALLAVHDSILVDEDRNFIEKSFWGYFSPEFDSAEFDRHDYSRIFMGNVIQGCACAFRKVLFRQALPFPEAACHDEWLALVAIAKGGLLLVQEPLVEYRQGNNQIGALRPSIVQRMRKWSSNFKTASAKWFAERERRHEVLAAFRERHGEELDEMNRTALQQWLEFNSSRMKSVQKFSPRLLLAAGDYFRMFSSGWALKLWAKDLLIMLFGECVQRGKEEFS